MTLEIQTDPQIDQERQRTAAKVAREAMATRQARGLYGTDTTGQGALFADDPAIDLFSGPAAELAPVYREGQSLQITSLSGKVPVHAQGGGRPAIGDTVRVGIGLSAVNTDAFLDEPWYWCIGRNASGEYGAKITHSDLRPA